MKKAFFFDRDGIINKRLINQYVKNISEFHFLDGFIDLFNLVIEKGFIPIVITNQQGVGKGLMSEKDLVDIHNFMQKSLFEITKNQFADIIYCTDTKEKNSPRRKPEPGMIIEAIDTWGIDATVSWMIGDSISDVIAGYKANTNTILIGNYIDEEAKDASFIFKNIFDAIDFVKTLEN